MNPPIALTAMLGPLDGGCRPGGCASCDAYRTVEAVAEGVWQQTTHHDPGCPRLVALAANRAARRAARR